MKIALISPDSGGGGIYRFYDDLMAGLSPRADVHLILSDPFGDTSGAVPMDAVSPDDDNPIGGLLLRALPQLLKMISVAHAGWERALRLEPDVIEVCDWPLGFVPAVLGQSIPYVVQCHGSMGQVGQHDPQQGQRLEEATVQLIEPELLRVAHRVTTYSHANAQFWRDMTGRPVEMIYPAYALPPEAELTDTVSSAGAVFGRLQRWKGPHILCGALERLGDRAPVIEWRGDTKPWLSADWPTDRKLAADYPAVWGSRLLHQPAVPRDVVARIQASALFNIVPSTWDVFNFTAVEAMGAARPTIVSSGAGASELIVDGENGFLFENGSAESLAAAIDRVMTLSDARRRDVGRVGRQTIAAKLDPGTIAEKRLDAYAEAVQSFDRQPPAKPNPWIADLLHPAYGAQSDPGILLDLIPVRAAAGKVKDGLLQKLGWARRFS